MRFRECGCNKQRMLEIEMVLGSVVSDSCKPITSLCMYELFNYFTQ